ncbi:hypothetical protein AWB76_07016 [Caballeronia temeraria]|uniref:SMP-30/Gluconolactonase/LRE-like region domain-containing protein n=2 Tax=Caballeronia temeraria TaxID=1777137 RepID=A0A158DJ81_9BURK|nr:hypothetical protein AWB76_07016 [Caballeronia temeraria]
MLYISGKNWVLADARRGAEGGIRIIDVKEKNFTTIFPLAEGVDEWDKNTYGACSGPLTNADKAKFVTHGLAIRKRKGDIYTLYAVHHGDRESIEVFALDASRSPPSATWIGCVVAPDPIGLNSVAALPNEGFVATNFMPRNGPADALEKLRTGEQNGELWTWYPSQGWSKVADSESAGANGVEASEDGKTFYVAEWGSQTFFRLRLDGKTSQRDSISLGFRVDNVHFAPDGSLVVAGQHEDMTGAVAVKINPQSLRVTPLVDYAKTPGWVGGASVAVAVGDQLWLGLSVGSNRVAIVPAPK